MLLLTVVRPYQEDVRMIPPQKDNTMQSFFLAETLKYFYLIFCDSDVINLDEWVRRLTQEMRV